MSFLKDIRKFMSGREFNDIWKSLIRFQKLHGQGFVSLEKYFEVIRQQKSVIIMDEEL